VFPFLIGRIRTGTADCVIVYDQKMFPFLIGRIRTKVIRKIYSFLQNWFPFLIGRIRTTDPPYGINVPMEFPFLIGRIRTKFSYACFHGLRWYVSIPHR